MKVRVLRERCVCGSKWSLGVDAIVHAHDMDPSYRDWQGRHRDCRDRLANRKAAAAQTSATRPRGAVRRVIARALALAT